MRSLEIPHRAIPTSPRKGKVFDRQAENRLQCRACHKLAIPKAASSLYLAPIPANALNLKIVPSFYASEARTLLLDLTSRQWRISRIRETPIGINEGGRHFWLDVDFLWSLMLDTLAAEDMEVSVLVASNRSLRQALIVASMFRVIRTSQAQQCLILTPYLVEPGIGRLENTSYHTDRICSVHDASSVRVWLSCALNWHQKDNVLSTRSLLGVVQSLNRLEVELTRLSPRNCDPASLIDHLNSKTVNDTLARARKGRPVPEKANCLWVLLAPTPVKDHVEQPLPEGLRLFILALREGLGGNLVGILLHGSATTHLAGLTSDQDVVIVLKTRTPDSAELIAEMASRFTSSALVDFQLIYLNQLSDDGDFFSLHTCGPFFISRLASARVLFGRNVIGSIHVPSARQVKLSLLQKVQQYVYTGRQTVIQSRTSLTDAALMLTLKRLWMIVGDLLLWIGTDAEDGVRMFREFQAHFFALIAREEHAFLRKWFDWRGPIRAKLHAMNAADRRRFLDECVSLMETLYDIILTLAKDEFGLIRLGE